MSDEVWAKVYKKVAPGHYKCRKCDSTIMAVKVNVPVVQDGFWLREMDTEERPYCPKCDPKPPTGVFG